MYVYIYIYIDTYPMLLPRRVLQTSLCTRSLSDSVLQTLMGMGMKPILYCCIHFL